MLLHLTATHLTGIAYLFTAVSVCGLEEIFLELHTCFLVFKVMHVFLNLRHSSLIYVTALLILKGSQEWCAKMAQN